MGVRNDAVVCRLRAVRQARGISQSLLAERVGVKRQAIYDIESGRYLPNTALALRLARHLACRVEDLFVEPLAEPEQAVHLADPAARRATRVVVGRLRGRMLAYPLEGENAFREGLRPADGILDPGEGRVRLLCTEERVERTAVLLGCDPAFSLLGEHMARRTPEARLHCRFASSRRALEALHGGTAHVAGSHLHNRGGGESNVALAERFLPDSGALVMGFSLMEEGLMVAPGNPLCVRGVPDLAGGEIRFVNRESGAALRSLLDDHLHRAGIPATEVQGYGSEASSHLDGAHRVAHGTADAALGLRAVADACGLGFVPIEAVRCDLVVPFDLVDHPAVRVLLDTLQTRLFREELAAIPGYEASRTGDRIADIDPRPDPRAPGGGDGASGPSPGGCSLPPRQETVW